MEPSGEPPTTILCDNHSAFKLSKNNICHEKRKHLRGGLSGKSNGVANIKIHLSYGKLDFIILESPNSKTGAFRFLVDTGASVNLVKACKLTPETRFKKAERITLQGISPGRPVQTEGTCQIPLRFGSEITTAQFQILNQPPNVPSDGLVGKDFFREQRACINYDDHTIHLKSFSKSLPLIPERESQNQESILLKARSETIVQIKVANPEIEEGVIPELHLSDHVYLSKAMVSVVANNKALATIVNTDVTDHLIEPIPVTLEPLLPDSYPTFMSDKIPKDRVQVPQNLLTLDHLNDEEKASITGICKKYHDVFFLPGDTLSATSSLEYEIRLSDTAPQYAKTYRYPQVHQEEVDKQISDMLKQGIIQPSNSPWSAPLWAVPKKPDSSGNKRWRIVIDYRKLNQVTIGDRFPIPNIEENLDQLGHSKYLTTLDLASGFHQIPVKPSDRPKTVFSTPTGHYEFTRMPFGLKNAPSTFQRVMNAILSGLQGSHCFVYLDDIVIHASSLQQHSEKLSAILDRLRCANLKLQPEKCNF
ncbi:UNVERIFIED_CONTAM: hypothetical protein PYX00_010798 [Menopon gallinae]|uniref:Reverse transcriptase domain-containing protein n=1 Tax=Menopon gallinae TaxID=328185 RepID=A0AAW2HGT2_9NEOP